MPNVDQMTASTVVTSTNQYASEAKDWAESRKFEAEAASINAQTKIREQRNANILDLTQRKLELELRTTQAIADMNEMQRDQARRSDELNKADDLWHERYQFTGKIDGKSVNECINRLTWWANSKPGCAITIIFNSPGGSFFEGMMLFDFIEELKGRGHKVIVGTYGLAASMAGILLQAGSVRYVGAESWTMIHELSDGVQGSASVIADHAAFNTRLTERITNIFLKRSEGKISRDDFIAGFNRKEWWLSSDDMLKYGFADYVGFPIPEPELLDTPVVQEQQEL